MPSHGSQTKPQLIQTPENAEQAQCSDKAAMLRQMDDKNGKKEDLEEEEEKEDNQEDKAII